MLLEPEEKVKAGEKSLQAEKPEEKETVLLEPAPTEKEVESEETEVPKKRKNADVALDPPKKRAKKASPPPKQVKSQEVKLVPGDSNEQVIAWLEAKKLKPQYITVFQEEGVTADEIFYDVDEQLLIEDFSLPKLRARRLMGHIIQLRQTAPPPQESHHLPLRQMKSPKPPPKPILPRKRRADIPLDPPPPVKKFVQEKVGSAENPIDLDAIELDDTEHVAEPTGVYAEAPSTFEAEETDDYVEDMEMPTLQDIGPKYRVAKMKKVEGAIKSISGFMKHCSNKKDPKFQDAYHKLQNIITRLEHFMIDCETMTSMEMYEHEDMIMAHHEMFLLRGNIFHSGDLFNAKHKKQLTAAYWEIHKIRHMRAAFELNAHYFSLISQVGRWTDEDLRRKFKTHPSMVEWHKMVKNLSVDMQPTPQRYKYLSIPEIVDSMGVLDRNFPKFLSMNHKEVMHKSIDFLRSLIEMQDQLPDDNEPRSPWNECFECKELKGESDFSKSQWRNATSVVPGRWGICFACQKRNQMGQWNPDGRDGRTKKKNQQKKNQQKKKNNPPQGNNNQGSKKAKKKRKRSKRNRKRNSRPLPAPEDPHHDGVRLAGPKVWVVEEEGVRRELPQNYRTYEVQHPHEPEYMDYRPDIQSREEPLWEHTPPAFEPRYSPPPPVHYPVPMQHVAKRTLPLSLYPPGSGVRQNFPPPGPRIHPSRMQNMRPRIRPPHIQHVMQTRTPSPEYFY